MPTVWEQEMARETELIESMSPPARLDLVMQVAAWTRETLPDEHRRLLRRKADSTLDKAVTFVKSLQRGDALSERTFEALLVKLDSFDDQPRLQELGRLFEGFSLAIDMAAAADAPTHTIEAALEAFYDVIRDAARLPGSDVVTGSSLDPAERASDVCRGAIAKQKELIASAAART